MARKIHDELFKFIDNKLKNHGAAQLAIKNGDARNLMIYAAEACVGIKEEGGNNNGKFISLIQKTVDDKASSEAWCMCFVQSMIAYAERKIGVVSPVYASEHCMTTFRKTPAANKVKNIPAPGAITIWKNGSTDAGHTGFMLDYQGDSREFESIEGNTGSGNMRDGDGVYIKQRSKKKSGSLVIQGYLIPFAAYKQTPVGAKDYSLAWETKLDKSVSKFLVSKVKENLAVIASAKDITEIHKDFSKLSEEQQVKLLTCFFVAMAKYESGYNPRAHSVDVGTKDDKGSWSVGLYQMSANDSAAKKFKATFESLQEPEMNIQVAMEQMTKQIKNTGLIFLPNTSKYRYWAVILKGNKYSKIPTIIEETFKNYNKQ